jgi:hypothetical protein
MLFGIAFIYFINPETSLYPPCIFKKLTSLQCPGCGSARACYHLLHGNFLTAIDHNILMTAFLPLLIIEGFARLFLNNHNNATRLRVIENNIRPFHVLIIVITFWILRNLELYPFQLLSSDF